MGFAVNTTRSAAPTSKAPKYVWPMLDGMAYQMEYLGSKNKMEKSFETKDFADDDPRVVWVPRIEFAFVMLRPGAHEAMLDIEAMDDTPEREKALEAWETKYKKKSHGRMFWLTVNEPKYLAIAGEPGVKKLSNLYLKVLKGLLNNGLDLTREHVQGLVGLVNALEGKDGEGNPTPELEAGTFVRPQFMVLVDEDPAKQSNKAVKVNRRIAEDEYLPSFRPFKQLVDKRWAGEDPSIVCAETGEAIHGYELKFGDDAGKWVTQAEAAKRSVELYGKVYGPAAQRRLKAEKEAQSAGQAAPAAKTKKDEKLPF